MEQEFVERNSEQQRERSSDENFDPQKVADENIRLHRENAGGGAASTRRSQERSEAYPEHGEHDSKTDEGKPRDVSSEGEQSSAAGQGRESSESGGKRHRSHTGG